MEGKFNFSIIDFDSHTNYCFWFFIRWRTNYSALCWPRNFDSFASVLLRLPKNKQAGDNYYFSRKINYRKRKIYVGGRTFDDLTEVIKKYPDESYILPGPDVLSPAIEEKLDNLEIRWKKGVFYKTVISDLSDLKNVFYDILVFFSPSGIESLFKNFPDFKQNDTIIAAFGKNTVKAAEEKGLKINIEAPRKRVSSMSRALEIFIEDSRKKI